MGAGASKIAIAFVPRAEPLAPKAAAARGAAARALVDRLLARDDATLAKLSGVGSGEIVIVMGEAALLPWVDGIVYLGHDLEAPSLLLPTTLAPDVPTALFEGALLAKTRARPPIAVLVDPRALVSLAGARALDRAHLTALREASR